MAIMNLKSTRELHAFLSTYFPDADLEADEETTRAYAAASSQENQDQVIAQAKLVIAAPEFPLEEIGTEANRWFGDAEEGRTWLKQIVGVLEASRAGAGAGGAVIVKDSNGTPLAEGDSVTVIKDLKVKGGSSDLKRGTTIRKIHLIDDPELIECRVDGSTLVLKTCFLKKA